MNVALEWSRCYRILEVTKLQWNENILPRARAANLVNFGETMMVNLLFGIIKEYLDTKEPSIANVIEVHTALQRLNNFGAMIASRLGMNILRTSSSNV
jgi:hypothetical protein